MSVTISRKRHISEKIPTCPGRMREINLRDQSHTSRSWGPEISRFGVDYVRLSIWIQHLWEDEFFFFTQIEAK